MVRKIIVTMSMLALIFGYAVSAQAVTYNVYDGTPSNTYITYYKDILSGSSILDNYVCFRSGQSEYHLILGDVVYENGVFSVDGTAKDYKLSSDGGYSSYYAYDISEITSLSVSPGDKLIYSNLGDYPHLIERGAQIETITAVLLGIAMLYYVVSRIFGHS